MGGWLVASFLALWIACPSSAPETRIGADVHVLKDSLLGGQQILVRNESDEVWTDVVLTLDRHLEQPSSAPCAPGSRWCSPRPSSSAAASRPRATSAPKRLDVECRQGKAGFDLR